MGRPALQMLLFVAALVLPAAAGGFGNAEIERRISEMRRRLSEEESGLRAVEADRRRLNTKKSIYSNWPGKTQYTTQESQFGAMDHMWLLICGALVMFMQGGFAMLEAGFCRVKNVQSILLKNFTDVCMGTLGWWIFGWSFAYSGPYMSYDGVTKKNNFAGYEEFAGHTFLEERDDTHEMEPTTKIVNWFFQWAFCSAAATIVSGGVAERVNFPGYCIFSFLMSSFIYPIIVAWTWGYGWLYDMNTPGYMDFAGSGVVHLTGGIGALVGAIIAGPRKGRWDDQGAKARLVETPEKFIPHSQPLIALGTFILWFGWYGFNCGSTLTMHSAEKAFLAAQVAMNTTIAAATGGLTNFIIRYAMQKKYDLPAMCSGILGGLVSITAGCGNVECGTACLIGFCGGILCQLASSALRIAKIDDPVDAFAVHGMCGMWGVFAAAVFDWGYGFEHVHGWNGFKCAGWTAGKACPDDGTNKQGGNQIAANFAEIFGIIAWSGGLSAIVFAVLRVAGFLRTADDIQEPGLDRSKHSPVKGYDVNDPNCNIGAGALKSI